MDLDLGDIQEDLEDLYAFLVDLMDDYQHYDSKEDHEDYAAYKHYDLHVHVPAYLGRYALFSRIGIRDHYLLDLFAVLDQVLDGGRRRCFVILDEVALVLGLAHVAVHADCVVDEREEELIGEEGLVDPAHQHWDLVGLRALEFYLLEVVQIISVDVGEPCSCFGGRTIGDQLQSVEQTQLFGYCSNDEVLVCDF